MSTEVRDAGQRNRYEIVVDGEVAGFAEYRDMGGTRVFTHTEIGDAFGGRGLGSRLVRAALDDVRTAGRTIVALCPFVASAVREHAEYQALVDPELDARLRGRRDSQSRRSSSTGPVGPGTTRTSPAS